MQLSAFTCTFVKWYSLMKKRLKNLTVIPAPMQTMKSDVATKYGTYSARKRPPQAGGVECTTVGSQSSCGRQPPSPTSVSPGPRDMDSVRIIAFRVKYFPRWPGGTESAKTASAALDASSK